MSSNEEIMNRLEKLEEENRILQQKLNNVMLLLSSNKDTKEFAKKLYNGYQMSFTKCGVCYFIETNTKQMTECSCHYRKN